MIKSLLDTDLYKLTMQQAFFFYQKQNPEKRISSYNFTCRSKENLLIIKDKIADELNNYKKLKFTKEEVNYLRENYSFFKEEYLDFLSNLSLEDCIVDVREENNELKISVKGEWLKSILFEIPTLAIVQELYWIEYIETNKLNFEEFYEKGYSLLEDKVDLINRNKINFLEFGTRRRFSLKWQKESLKYFKENINTDLFKGTSNIFLAKELNIEAKGTTAHEFFQAFQVLTNLEDSQKNALLFWKEIYGADLNVALTDIFGIDVFNKDMSKELWLHYDGYRHDSGDPVVFGNKIIKELKKYNIDPKTKSLLFSDGLKFNQELVDLNKKFKNKINVFSCIGTQSTNDFDNLHNHKALSIVMKLDRINDQATIKVSDERNKITTTDLDLKNKAILMIEKKLKQGEKNEE